ncbi:MAG: hypothetical protein ACFFCT_11240 [Candidatus Odinarchaeota archaeon]
MKTKRAIILVCVIMIALVVISIQFSNTSMIMWPFAEGDILNFRIDVYGFWYRSSVPYSNLNGTLLHANITTLHDLRFSYELSFNYLITKIRTTTHLDNGSLAPVELNKLISRSLVPLGTYHVIDSWFGDEPERRDTFQENFSSSGISQLIYGFSHGSTDLFYGWKCVINTTTGYPVLIETWRDENLPYDYLNYRIILTFIDQD